MQGSDPFQKIQSGVELDCIFMLYFSGDCAQRNPFFMIGVLYMNMKILRQLGIILALCLAAEFIVSMLPIAFPSSVTAILILAALLGLKLLQEGHIQETADFMLSNMAIVFVPVSIGMVEDIGLLKGRMKGFLIVVCVSLVLTFLGTYVTVRIVQICMERLAGKGGASDE